MNLLVPLPFLVPLLGATVAIAVGRWRAAQRVVSLVALTAVVATSAALLVQVRRHGPQVMQAGGWEAPLGISLVADLLSTIMLTVSAVTMLCVLVYAIGQGGVERTHVGFHSVYLVLAAGVSLAFLTGDLFTLFVSFEMFLTASYVLLTLGGRVDQVRHGMTYVVISLLASMLFLTAVGVIYGAAGTVNMADLSVRLADLPVGLQTAFAVLLLAVFGIKAAVFPLYFWLPDSYPTAPGPVTAIFAGLLTKVGVYALLRSQTLLFTPEARPATLLVVVAGLTMIVGGFGAIAQYDVKRILSFHIIAQIGYMVLGLGLFTVAGLAATVYFVVHQIPVKTALFLTGGLIERAGGSSRLSRIGGLAHTAPMVAILFLLPALSLAGLPPLSGFVAKLGLVDAGLDDGRWGAVAIALAGSVLTLFSMIKIWSGTFWGVPDEDPEAEPQPTGRLGGPALMVLPTLALVAVTIAIAVFAGPLYDLSRDAATELLEPARYVQEVLGP